jgi:3-oxoacyl-[acyl-carrier-protein] synthase II
MDPKEARRNDRYTHFGYVAAREAVKDAGLDMAREDGDMVGVIIGSGIGGMFTYESQLRVLAERGPRKVSPFTIPSLIGNMCAGLVAIDLGARGPSFGIVSACATGTHSIGEAAHAIRRGDAEVMIAGGSEAAITPFSYASFCSMKAMSTRNDEPQRACRPFDVNRDGFIMGEGAGVLVLESLAHAQARGARVYCELVGYAASCDAYHITSPDPDGKGLSLAMRRALSSGGVTPDQVDYINAHGTSTPVGDLAELGAVRQVFGQEVPPISSTKSLSGHSLGAAGVQEAIYCLLMMREGFAAASAHIEQLDPAAEGMPVLRERLAPPRFRRRARQKWPHLVLIVIVCGAGRRRCRRRRR